MSPYIYLQVESRSEVLYFRQYRLFFLFSGTIDALSKIILKSLSTGRERQKGQHPLLSLGQDTITRWRN